MKTKLSSSMRRFLFVIGFPQAQIEIKEFRNQWGIDSDGFDNNGSYNAWLIKTRGQSIFKKCLTISRSIRTKYLIAENSIRRKSYLEKYKATSEKSSPETRFNEYFQKSVDELGAKIKMDNNWTKLFTDYTLWGNKALKLEDPQELEVYKTTEYYSRGKPIREKLEVIIEPNTKKEDLLSTWELFLENEKDSLTGYINVPTNLKDETILERAGVKSQTKKRAV